MKSRYDGRGLECTKWAKGAKEDQEREQTSLRMEGSDWKRVETCRQGKKRGDLQDG